MQGPEGLTEDEIDTEFDEVEREAALLGGGGHQREQCRGGHV